MNSGNAGSSVLVSRSDLVQALRFIAAAGSRTKAGPAILRANGPIMILERAGQTQEIAAQGTAEFEAEFELDFAKFASKLPADDPLEVGFDGAHISFGRYRHPAKPPVAQSALEAVAGRENQRRIARAVEILEPYLVKDIDLKPLCREESKFTVGEQALTDRIAKAWAELAPYGVTPDDLKHLISANLKNAWRR